MLDAVWVGKKLKCLIRQKGEKNERNCSHRGWVSGHFHHFNIRDKVEKRVKDDREGEDLASKAF